MLPRLADLETKIVISSRPIDLLGTTMFITREPTSILLLTRTPLVIALMAFSSFASNATTEEHFRITVEPSPLKVFLRHLAPARRQPVREGRVVLILHGGTLPSGASSAFRMDGHSWMDDLSDAGFDVWALDYLGYGGSDRYPEMSAPLRRINH